MIHIHNTLTGRREPFEPVQAGEIRMYVCGITPYDKCHLGHARCYVVFDLVRRVFSANGIKVRYIQNFTDIDDKIIKRAREQKKAPLALANEYIEDYFNKMDALGVGRADLYPRVTEHIPDIIALIRKIIDKKAAYRLGNDVYFSVRQDVAYGKLSKRPIEDLISGARVEVNPDKKDPLDFALWKGSPPDDPPEASWESPWGRGRPGWHIECSVMALKHLGANFDIHGGGLDLIFPHHENEIAQSETATGLPFANFWMHNGFVTVNREKMSKSLGNFFSLSDIFATYQPAVVRYMLLTVHYRSPLDFSTDLLDQSRQALSGLKDSIARATFAMRKAVKGASSSTPASPELQTEIQRIEEEFNEALRDDFNAPEALGQLHQMMAILDKHAIATVVSPVLLRSILDRIEKMTGVLGLDLFSFMQGVLVSSHVTEMAEAREAARKSKDWSEADRLRKAILDAGYVVEDTPQGPRLLPKAN